MKDVKRAFREGFFAGVGLGRELSDREVGDLRPDLSARERDAFSNGVVDAVAGDSFRLDLLDLQEGERS